MSRKYETPEFEMIRFGVNQSVFTSGPSDLDDGDDFNPDNPGGSGAKANDYFADED